MVSASTLPPGADERALRLAHFVVGHDETKTREDDLARGLIAEHELTVALRRELAELRGVPMVERV